MGRCPKMENTLENAVKMRKWTLSYSVTFNIKKIKVVERDFLYPMVPISHSGVHGKVSKYGNYF